MAEPARNPPIPGDQEPDDDPEFPVLQRWVRRPDGRHELLERPLTPEDFLNPRPEDTMAQGELHSTMRSELAGMLRRHFQPAALVLEDVIHKLGPGLPAPAPDVSVILGARPGKRSSFSVPREKVRPDLIVEIVSPSSRRIRDVDEVDKVKAYAQAGIPEYLLIDLPRLGNGERLGLKGYRLGPDGRYSPIQPDSRGRFFCTVTRLWFFVSPEGDRVRVLDDRTGKLLLYSDEIEAARETVEAENARLREELERLKSGLGTD